MFDSALIKSYRNGSALLQCSKCIIKKNIRNESKEHTEVRTRGTRSLIVEIQLLIQLTVL